MLSRLKHLCRERKGATAIEYAIIVTGVGIVLAGVVWSVGDNIQWLFTEIGWDLDPNGGVNIG